MATSIAVSSSNEEFGIYPILRDLEHYRVVCQDCKQHVGQCSCPGHVYRKERVIVCHDCKRRRQQKGV